MKTFIKILAVILLINLGFAAIYGGWMLISDPSGAKFKWSVELLESTPFQNFLIPGIILFVMNGLLSLTIAVLTIAKTAKHEWLIIMQGCILIGWLTIEILFDRDLYEPIVTIPSYATGILLIICGLILLKRK